MSDLYEDKELTCSERNCGKTFIFTAGEQRFYAAPERNFTPPRRCPNCRALRKAQKEGGGASAGPTMPPPGQTFVYEDHGGGGGRGRGGRRGRDDEDEGRGRRRR